MEKQLSNTTENLIHFLQKQNIEQQSTIKQLALQIESLRHRLDKMLHLLYGTKSEKKASSTTDDNSHFVLPKQKNQSSTQSKNGRGALPKDLPRVSIQHDIAEDKRYCDCCGIPWHCIGQVVTEQLEFKPAEFFVKEHVRYKYACRACESVFIADLPPQPIDKGLAGWGISGDCHQQVSRCLTALSATTAFCTSWN